MTTQPTIKVVLLGDLLKTIERLKLNPDDLILTPIQFFALHTYNEELAILSNYTQKVIHPPDTYEGFFYKKNRLIVLHHRFIMREYDINGSVPENISSKFPAFTRWLKGQGPPLNPRSLL